MTSNKVVIFGTYGQVANALRQQFPRAAIIGRTECDFEKPESIIGVLDRHRPSLILNPAAFTNVDKSEAERERAWRINAEAPHQIAKWCAKNSADLIHYSTDYVYSGTGFAAWKESDAADPINFYGQTKLEGEHAISASGCRYVILRTSWVFSPRSQNFLNIMMKLGREQETIKVVDDQTGCPTFSRDLAEATKAITLNPNFGRVSGVFNLVNQGSVSRFEFANKIFEVLRSLGYPLKVKRIEPVSSKEFPAAARRPLNCRLDTLKAEETFGVHMRRWDLALTECLKSIGVVHIDGQMG